MAPDYPLTAQLAYIPGGAAGARATVKLMRSSVNAYKCDPRIIQVSVSTIFPTPEFNDEAEITRLYQLVSENIRYVRDVYGVESLCEPVNTLNRRVGDCDDQACLLATLLESVGYPTRFVIAGYQSRDFEHVYLQVWAMGEWIDLDPTLQNGVGWAPPNPVSIEFERV